MNDFSNRLKFNRLREVFITFNVQCSTFNVEIWVKSLHDFTQISRTFQPKQSMISLKSSLDFIEK